MLVVAVVLWFATAALWAPVLGAGPFWDDRGTLAQVPWLEGPWSAFWPQALAPHLGHWQPLTWLSLRLDGPLLAGIADDLLGPDRLHRAIGKHLLGNVLLHATSTVLLFALLLRALRLAAATAALPGWARVAAAGWGALVWAIHPTRVESVAWLTERRDVLSTLLLLLGLWLWLGARARWGESRRDGAGHDGALAVLAFAASALAKAWVIALPGALLGLEIAVFAALSRPDGLLGAIRRSAAWLALSLPIAAIAAWAQHAAGATAGVEGVGGLSPIERLIGALAALPRYLGLTLWPATLSPLHPIVPGQALAPLSLVAAAATLVAAIALWRARARWPGLLGAAIGAVAWLAPVLGLLQSGVQAIAERYLILAHVPLAVLGASVLATGLGEGVTPLDDGGGRPGRWRPGRWTLPAAVLASLLLPPLLVRLLLWQDVWIAGEEALWTAAIEAEPASPHALANRASMRLQRGAHAEAAADLDAALRLAPGLGNAWMLRAELSRADARDAARRGDPAAAAVASRRALGELDRAVAADPTDAASRCNRGALRAELGDGVGAASDLDAAIAAGGDGACRLNRAVFLARSGDRGRAALDVAAALGMLPRDDPNYARALGMARALGLPAPAP